jgi:hypothetical protein
MNDPTRHSPPGGLTVLLAQIRLVERAMRTPALVAAALIGLATLILTIEIVDTSTVIPFHPEHHVLPGLLGLLLPVGVWMGEERFGAAFLWTLPVDRRRHALAKVFAGWVWLMGAVALLVIWLLGLALFSGGNVLAEETRRVLWSFSVAAAGPFDPNAVQEVRWTPHPLFWMVPFTAATGTYLLASALALGSPHPLRWIAATLCGFFLLVALVDSASAERLIQGAHGLLDALVKGRYGVDALLTARTESLQVAATLSTGETLVVWSALPDLGQWARATLLWTGAGLAAVWAAASRHRERRRV